MTREEYALKWSSGYNRNGSPVVVPANIERVEDHTPCFYCGTRAGLPCRHRSIAA
jgi:hypothetical protein